MWQHNAELVLHEFSTQHIFSMKGPSLKRKIGLPATLTQVYSIVDIYSGQPSKFFNHLLVLFPFFSFYSTLSLSPLQNPIK